jgi:hypothetical protein
MLLLLLSFRRHVALPFVLHRRSSLDVRLGFPLPSFGQIVDAMDGTGHVLPGAARSFDDQGGEILHQDIPWG